MSDKKCYTSLWNTLKSTATTTKQQDMKDKSFDRWMAHLLMKNSDQKKYGSLLTGLTTQYSMGNNQFPDKITNATDVLANHKHDNYDPKKRNPTKQVEEKQPEKDEAVEQSFAQDESACCCCGKHGHKSPECPEKNKISKEKWCQKTVSRYIFSPLYITIV